ncbi:MAG: hypothetical protein QOI41_6250 [Myxococcales bacterium]|nr:hypothetical protein [Myxococcales bacterium]
MKRRHAIGARRLAIIVTVASCTTIGALACSTSGDARRPFDEGVDSAGGASLPDAMADATASPESDASHKPPFAPDDEAVVCATAPCATQIVAGEGHFCARMSDGTARCWGDDTRGSLGAMEPPTDADAGDAGTADAGDAGGGATIPPVTGLTGAVRLSAGGTTTCAALNDGAVRCWGGNDTGQLGLSAAPAIFDEDPHHDPTSVALPSAALRVDVGQRGACAVLAAGSVWCWGDNTQRQLARVTSEDIAGPAAAQLGGLAVAWTAAGTGTSFGVTTAGVVFSWGAVASSYGTVAARTASVSPDPLPLSIGLSSVTSLAVSSTTLVPQYGTYPPPPPLGVAHACAVVKGEVFCWGVSQLGALAIGLPDPAPKPTRTVVESEKAWPQQVAAGGDITCVRLTDGSVQCAGDNSLGALGKDPKQGFSMFFRPVATLNEHAVQVAVSAHSVCALVQGGRVLCWGGNQNGELGLRPADGDPHPTPAPIGF